MTQARRRQILARARKFGYTGPNNLGNLWGWANSWNAETRRAPVVGNQRRAMQDIAGTLSGSA